MGKAPAGTVGGELALAAGHLGGMCTAGPGCPHGIGVGPATDPDSLAQEPRADDWA